MRNFLFLVILVGTIAAGTLWVFSRPCGGMGHDGCEARHQLRDIVVTGDTIASDTDGRLWIAGVHYSAGRRDRLYSEMVLVIADPETGEEIERMPLGMEGRPDQLRLAPRGEGFAISCNGLYVCDLPGGNRPRETEVMMFDAAGERLWFAGVEHRHAPPDSDGRAFELAFSPTGQIVFAHVAHLARTGNVILTKQQPLVGPTGQLVAADSQAHGGLARKLDLPEGFIPFRRHGTAISPDGKRIAVLARHFSGPGAVRAAIRIFDIDSGALLARHDIGDNLAPAILWHPHRDAVIVALAGASAADAGTELRFYDAGEQE